MNNLNYLPLDVESNIYGMTTLKFDDGTTKVLVATFNCQIYCINYNKYQAHTKEVQFTYIPHGARIISIGALRRGSNDFVIGITLSVGSSVQKTATRSATGAGRDVGDFSNKPTTYYFNIYASGSPFDLDYSTQGCQTIRLPFVPYHLYQTEIITYCDLEGVKKKPFWLLSGGDNRIHAFLEDQPYQSYSEVEIEECFTELRSVSGLVLWIDVMYTKHRADVYERAIALGFEDGSVKLFVSAMTTKKNSKFQLIKEASFEAYNTIIPSVRFFKVNSTENSQLKEFLMKENLLKQSPNNKLDQVNLLVVSSTDPSLVFENVLDSGLDLKRELPDSRRLDCAVTSAIDDINLDGMNEILIGTHGRELLTYRYNPEKAGYILDSQTELNHPVFAISILDITGDALKEVAILLASGLLIMQASIKDVINVLKRRVDILLDKIDNK